MLIDYLPIFIFFVLAVDLPSLSSSLPPSSESERSPQKMIPYECGMDPIGQARSPFR
jgi:NADH:ubiquinone oxidoreductase subunit 3 (subunit A)